MISGCVKRALAISLALGGWSAPGLAQGGIEIAGEAFTFEMGSGPVTVATDGLGMRSSLARHRTQPVTAEEIERYRAYLGLDTEQTVLTMEMFAEFDRRLQEINAKEQQSMMDLSAELRKQREEGARPDPNRAMELMRSVEEQRRLLGAQRAALGEEFLEDLKLVLNAEQLERWPGLERMRKRDRHLAPGTFPGEDVDLIAVCGELELVFDPEQVSEGWETLLAETLQRYEVEIDRLLQQRMDIAASHPMAGVMTERPVGAIDIKLDDLEAWQSKHREAGQRLQRAQLKYVRQISGWLDPDSRAAFEARIRQLSYPTVLQPSGFDRHLEQILALDDLDPEQKERLDTMRADYARARARLDDAWIRAIDSELASGSGQGSTPPAIGGMQVFVMGESQESERNKARAARRALDEQWIGNLREHLRPEQRERVARPATRRQAVMMTGFNGGNPEDEGGMVIEIREESGG
ncbi:MAG: hypothetical protein ACNA8P_11375 [Phycisphaerales bacterium]